VPELSQAFQTIYYEDIYYFLPLPLSYLNHTTERDILLLLIGNFYPENDII